MTPEYLRVIMKQKTRIRVGLLFAACVLLALAVAIGVGIHDYRQSDLHQLINPPAYRFASESRGQLTEEMAIRFTHKALIEAGKNSDNMYPVKHWMASDSEYSGEPYLLRNTENLNMGTVLWRVYESPPPPPDDWDYQVRIEKNGSEIVCVPFQEKSKVLAPKARKDAP